MRLLHQDEATPWIQTRLSNREHWVLIPIDGTGTLAVSRIEETYYNGDANEDFELVMLTAPELGLLALFFAKKNRLSTSELAKVVGHPPEMLEVRDIICLGENPDRAVPVLNFLMQRFSFDDPEASK